MLVKFDSSVGSLTMFGDVALELLKMMGHSGTVPGAILAADLPQAIARLESALGTLPPDARSTPGGNGKGDAAKVSLRQRAYPLIQLGRRAADAGANLMWERG